MPASKLRFARAGGNSEDSSSGNDSSTSSNEANEEAEAEAQPQPRTQSQHLGRADSTREKAKAHLASFSRPRAWMILLGVLLAACAGMVDVIAVRSMGMFVSHATGTTARIGERLEGVRSGDMEVFTLQHAFLTVFSFMFGAFLCGLVIPRNQMHFGGKQFYGVALMGNCLLLVVVTFVAPHFTAVYLSAMACGMQNAMCTMHLGAIVRTTHVTGTATDIGSTLGRMTMLLLQKGCASSRLRAFDRAEIQVDLQKLLIYVPLWVGFLIGAFWGAFLYSTVEMKEYAFLVPASITGGMAVAYMCFGKFLKKAFKAYERSKLQQNMEQVVEVLARTRSHLHMMEVGEQDNRQGTSDIDEDMVEELESDMEEMMAVMHEVSETLFEASGEHLSHVRRASSLPNRMRHT